MTTVRRSRKALILVAAGVVLLGVLGGALLGLRLGGAASIGGDGAPEKKPTTEQPQAPREGPGLVQLDEDAFAPEGEVGADQ